MGEKFIAYYRVSTQKQGVSGLGLDAQRESVAHFVRARGGDVCAEFVEVESGRKTSDVDRPELAAALAACKRQKAVLLVAKLDRLARSVYFVSGLMQNKVKFMAVDLPEASDITVHLMAAFGEYEAKRISERTKDALAMAKKRGVVLGSAGPQNLRPNIEQRQQRAAAFASKLSGVVDGMVQRGLTQRAMVNELNTLGVTTAAGGRWSLVQLQRLLIRVGHLASPAPQGAD